MKAKDMQQSHCLTILLLFTLFLLRTAAGQVYCTEIDGTVYGAQADQRGPIGGGEGYADTFTTGDLTVASVDGLLEALGTVQPGQVLFVEGETELNLTGRILVDKLELKLPEGVTLAGNRGHKGSRGAVLFSEALDTPSLIQVTGPGARITGLRLHGPTEDTFSDHYGKAFGKGGAGKRYYYKLPLARGILTDYSQLTVDNCELSGFTHAAIYLREGQNHQIHHNRITGNQYKGLGYGVCLNLATARIERNYFDRNRHSIAGTGRPGCSYKAIHNYVGPDSVSHCYDMHGGRDRNDGTDIAGTSITITNNYFLRSELCIRIRGIPEEGAFLSRNWFVHHDADGTAVESPGRTLVEDNAFGAVSRVYE